MIGYSYTYGNANGLTALSEYLSELVAEGGTDLNPNGMASLLGEPLIANDASLVCSCSAVATNKVFYFIPNNANR